MYVIFFTFIYVYKLYNNETPCDYYDAQWRVEVQQHTRPGHPFALVTGVEAKNEKFLSIPAYVMQRSLRIPGVRNICMMYAGYMMHVVREFCA
jgi:hypothetical protein